MGQISVSYFEDKGFDQRGPVLIVPKRFGDERGYFCETWNAADWEDAGLLKVGWVQDNEARSQKAGTLRGLHFQAPPFAQAKLIRAISGEVFDVAVDIRKGSPSFGKHVGVKLGAAGGEQLFVPQGFAHGYQTLTDDALVAYKCDEIYRPDAEGAVLWSDPTLGIDWPLGARAHLSEKDRAALPLSAQTSPFEYRS